MELRQDVPTDEESLESLLPHFILVAANTCDYGGMMQEVLVE